MSPRLSCTERRLSGAKGNDNEDAPGRNGDGANEAERYKRISVAISAPAERNIETAGNEPILSWHFRRTTPFDTLIIVIILVAGLGVIGRSQRSAHA
jgi:hypothetical protein